MNTHKNHQTKLRRINRHFRFSGEKNVVKDNQEENSADSSSQNARKLKIIIIFIFIKSMKLYKSMGLHTIPPFSDFLSSTAEACIRFGVHEWLQLNAYFQ